MAVQSSNQRVVKNTLILYARLGLTLIVGIWTSRIILNALGFTDQGLYNVVGGFVSFFAIISTSQSGAISRFITYELGKGKFKTVKEIFQTSWLIQLGICLLILVIAETFGLWFVNNKLVYPSDRVLEVNIVYQFSIASFIVSMLTISQNAVIIANEKMDVFAYISIFTSLAKLGISFIIKYSLSHRLVLYSALLFLVSLITFLFYTIYTYRKYIYCNYKLKFFKNHFKNMFSYSGWTLIGNSANVFRSSGISILLNIFSGPIANTINGIANQTNSLIYMFVSDFSTAFRPQIIKRYAVEEYDSLINLINLTTKFSFLLMTFLAIPIIFNIDFILKIWLKEVPDLTNIFVILTIFNTLIEAFSQPIIIAKQATGKIKNYQIIIGSILLLSFPLAYIFLKIGFPIYYSYVALLIITIITFIVRLFLLRGDIPLWSLSKFIYRVIIPMLILFIFCAIIPFIVKYFFKLNDWINLLISIIWTTIIIFFIGCNKIEREYVINFFKNKLLKR